MRDKSLVSRGPSLSERSTDASRGGQSPLAESRRGGRAATSEHGKKNAPAGRNGSVGPPRNAQDGGRGACERDARTSCHPAEGPYVLPCFSLVRESSSTAPDDVHLQPSALKASSRTRRRDWPELVNLPSRETPAGRHGASQQRPAPPSVTSRPFAPPQSAHAAARHSLADRQRGQREQAPIASTCRLREVVGGARVQVA